MQDQYNCLTTILMASREPEKHVAADAIERLSEWVLRNKDAPLEIRHLAEKLTSKP